MNIYYELEWDLFRDNALSTLSSFKSAISEPSTSRLVQNPWDRTDFWDVVPGETLGTPAKPRGRSKYAHMRALEDNPDRVEEPVKLSVIAEADEADDRLASAGKRMRRDGENGWDTKQAQYRAGGKGELSALGLDPSTPSKKRPRRAEMSPSGDEGDDFALPDYQESEEDVSDGVPTDEDASTPSDLPDSDIEAYPRTPRRRAQAGSASLATPRRRGVSSLAAPTPHSKAALRARANHKRARQLAVRPPPGPGHVSVEGTGGEDVDFGGEQDPWLRAMQVLHVASRPEGIEGNDGRSRDMLPCREAEYGRILGAVEELLEEGSGGCVCACYSTLHTSSTNSHL